MERKGERSIFPEERKYCKQEKNTRGETITAIGRYHVKQANESNNLSNTN